MAVTLVILLALLLAFAIVAVGVLLMRQSPMRLFLENLYSKQPLEAVRYLKKNLFSKRKFSEANDILMNMDMHTLDPKVIIEAVRLAYPFRDKLSYEALFIKARMGIASQGCPKKALQQMASLKPGD